MRLFLVPVRNGRDIVCPLEEVVHVMTDLLNRDSKRLVEHYRVQEVPSIQPVLRDQIEHFVDLPVVCSEEAVEALRALREIGIAHERGGVRRLHEGTSLVFVETPAPPK